MMKVIRVALVQTASWVIAQAITINFSGLSQPGTGSSALGDAVIQQGFSFADLMNGPFGNGFSVWQASSPNLAGLSSANTSLFETFAGSTTRLTATSSAPFTLNSIDLTQYNTPQAPGTFTVLFTGTRADNSTVTETFTVNRVAGTPVLQTFNFSSFSNVVRVDFTQRITGGSLTGAGYQFDNVVINATSAVREPGTMLLSVFTLAGSLVLCQLGRPRITEAGQN
jgi:hypothetical protein